MFQNLNIPPRTNYFIGVMRTKLKSELKFQDPPTHARKDSVSTDGHQVIKLINHTGSIDEKPGSKLPIIIPSYLYSNIIDLRSTCLNIPKQDIVIFVVFL